MNLPPPRLSQVSTKRATFSLQSPPRRTATSTKSIPHKNDLEACRNQQQFHLDSTGPYKLWLEINTQRHSAERYVNKYLNALTKSYQFPELHASTEENPDADAYYEVTPRSARELTVLIKIYRDSVLRDLRNLETLLAFTKTYRESQPDRAYKPSATAARWTAACTVTAVALPIKVTAGLPFFGAFAGVAALAGPPAWRLYQDRSFESIRADVNRLRHVFDDDLGAVDDRSRAMLKKKRFRYLKYELTGLFEI